MAESDPFAAVARRILPEGELRRCWPLEGGVSAILHGLEIETLDGHVRRVVVRRHRVADWKPDAEPATATEFALLAALHRLRLPVPEPCLLDTSGEIFPSPYFVMELIDGATAVCDPELPDALRQMADFLADLHAVDIASAGLPPLPEREDPSTGILELGILELGILDSLDSRALADRLRLALADQAPCTNPNPRVLVHGDFWPGNLLWRSGQLVAVLDFEDAALGDPLSDLASARLELLCAHDEASADAFTAHYCASTKVDLGRLALWEVYVSGAALAAMSRWGLAPEVEARRRRATRSFLGRAARELAARIA